MKNPSVSLPAVRGCLLLLLLGLSASTAAAELSIVRVYTGWRDAASFKRISEYFTGKENTAGQAILRSHPDQRAGFYFLVRVANPDVSRAVTARLELITDASARPVVHTFATTLQAGNTVFHLGLTGPDWPDPKADPVAWKLELTDDAGRILATEKSYLWEKPDGN